jgi:hypothetical protein
LAHSNLDSESMAHTRILIQVAGVILATLIPTTFYAQAPSTAANASLLQDSLHASVLTSGHQPFHLVLEVAPDETQGALARPVSPAMHATVELFWIGSDHYTLVLTSPSFNQTRIVEGERIEEHDTGDFSPRWLDNFVQMLLDPVPQEHIAQLMDRELPTGGSLVMLTRDKAGSINRTEILPPRCLATADRPGGITEETSVAGICFDASHAWLQRAWTFTHEVSFSDFANFAGQMIPRSWSDDIPQNIFLLGKVTVLERLSKADVAKIHVTTPTPPSNQIRTVFLSRADILSRIDNIPDLPWPPENTEKLEGYMIVYVRTDRAGNIRESYWDSSDNYKLQDAGVQLALMSKLKPLLVDGAPVQIEGPLVLHFKTHRSDAANPSK